MARSPKERGIDGPSLARRVPGRWRAAASIGMRRTLLLLVLALLLPWPASAAETITLWHRSIERAAVVDRPVRADGPAPLLLVLHGAMLNGATMRGLTDLPERARAAGFALAFPDAYGPIWNDEALARGFPAVFSGADDFGFLDALLARLVAMGVADPARIHLVGISNGGMMGFAYACRRAEKIASLVAFKATMAADAPATCRPARPLPVLMANATQDPIVRWDGRVVLAGLVDLHPRLPVEDGFRLWLDRNHCAGEAPRAMLPQLGSLDAPRIQLRAGACPADAPVLLYAIVGGGHRLPGGESSLLFRALGRASPDADAVRMVLDFTLPKRLP